jgi:hypothetical protein
MNMKRKIFGSVGIVLLSVIASPAAQVKTDLTPVESGGDMAIVAIEMTKNQQTLNTFYDGYGGGWGWRRGIR